MAMPTFHSPTYAARGTAPCIDKTRHMTAEEGAALEGGLAPASDERWTEFFAFDVTRPDLDEGTDGFSRWYELAYDLGTVQAFSWMDWLDGSGHRFTRDGDHEIRSVADAVRVITSIVRADRTNEGLLITQMGHGGLVTAGLRRLWQWYLDQRGSNEGYVDASLYSDDGVYRWSFERRWDVGGTLCWIGLNPGTGDTDGKKRPTLAKVCRLAESMNLPAVIVVNLFAYRSTDPKALRRAKVDIIGEHNDEAIRRAVQRSAVTLAAWGADGRLGNRGAAVAARHPDMVCLGTTSSGEPRHPLYVARSTRPTPYRGPN